MDTITDGLYMSVYFFKNYVYSENTKYALPASLIAIILVIQLV